MAPVEREPKLRPTLFDTAHVPALLTESPVAVARASIENDLALRGDVPLADVVAPILVETTRVSDGGLTEEKQDECDTARAGKRAETHRAQKTAPRSEWSAHTLTLPPAVSRAKEKS